MTGNLLERAQWDAGLPDPENQILQLKARRDRFGSHHDHRPHLCSHRSEDRLVWQTFRSLQLSGGLPGVCEWLGVSALKETLFWLLHAEKSGSEFQRRITDLILEVDGLMGGQMTEPDLVFLGRDTVAVVEAKLGRPGIKPTLWKDKHARRFGLYEDHWRTMQTDLFLDPLAPKDQKEFYQLIRMTFYAWAIADRLRLTPRVICLVNERNWDAPSFSIRQSFDHFASLLPDDASAPFPRANLTLVSWQQLREYLRVRDMAIAALDHHKCL